MGRDVYVKVRIRATNVRRFVRAFKAEYGERVEGVRGLKTEGDVLDCMLGWMDGARPARRSAKTGCWSFRGDDVVVLYWHERGFKEFFEWCVPYVDPKTARFELQIECGQNTYSRVRYKIVDGNLEEYGHAITKHD